MSSIRFIIEYSDDENEKIFVVGNIPELGCWDPNKSLELIKKNNKLKTQNIILNKN